MSYLKVICCGCGGHEFTAKVDSGQMLLTCTKCDDWRMVEVHITPGSHWGKQIARLPDDDIDEVPPK